MDPLQEISSKTDEELVSLTLQDQKHYLHLMKRYEAKIMRYILRLSSLSQDDAEDVAQEVFIKAYMNLHDFDVSLKFSSWLYRIAHNETISHFRRAKSRPQTLGLDDQDGDLIDKLAADPELQRSIDRRSDAGLVRDVIDGLDPKYREVLILRFLEEKDYREISDILQKPMGTIATLINRAKSAFRQQTAARGLKLN